MRFQECYSWKVYCRIHHSGEDLYSAFCGGDQTLRKGRIFLSLKFSMPSRRNQDCCASKKGHKIQQLNITEIERDKLVRFNDNSGFNVT